MRFAIPSFIALVAVAVQGVSLNPPTTVVRPNAFDDAPASVPATNAKRLAAGLPPLSPKAHRRRPHRGGPHVGTRPASAPRAVTSPLPPTSTKCNILVTDPTNGQSFGYIAPLWNIFGEYGVVQPTQAGALEVSFSYTPDSDLPTGLDFTATNSPSVSFPMVGATVGYVSTSNDLSTGSYNYAYLTGTTQIPYGPAQEADNNSFGATTGIPKGAESAIWVYNPSTQQITAQWVNTNGALPTTYIVYANDANQAFVLTGDLTVFREIFGAPYPQVTFTCVPPAATQVPPA